jgi:hypothetical protein
MVWRTGWQDGDGGIGMLETPALGGELVHMRREEQDVERLGRMESC